MVALMCLWYVELEDLGQAARSSPIIGRASVQAEKDDKLFDTCFPRCIYFFNISYKSFSQVKMEKFTQAQFRLFRKRVKPE